MKSNALHSFGCFIFRQTPPKYNYCLMYQHDPIPVPLEIESNPHVSSPSYGQTYTALDSPKQNVSLKCNNWVWPEKERKKPNTHTTQGHPNPWNSGADWGAGIARSVVAGTFILYIHMVGDPQWRHRRTQWTDGNESYTCDCVRWLISENSRREMVCTVFIFDGQCWFCFFCPIFG